MCHGLPCTTLCTEFPKVQVLSTDLLVQLGVGFLFFRKSWDFKLLSSAVGKCY
jgi:hypothetical protein